jgi:hypothetical protein
MEEMNPYIMMRRFEMKKKEDLLLIYPKKGTKNSTLKQPSMMRYTK